MSEKSEKRHPIVERWISGHNDAGGTIADLERELAAANAAKERAEARMAASAQREKLLASMCVVMMLDLGDPEAEQYREPARIAGESMRDDPMCLKDALDAALAGQEAKEG